MASTITSSRATSSRATSSRAVKASLAAALGVGAVGATTTGPLSAVVNGTDTSVTQHPWQVSLQDGHDHFCGGTIISARVILTAAHCVIDTSADEVIVRAGVTDRSDSSGQDIAVLSIELQPEYAWSDVGDAALLTLAQPLTFDERVQPIALASASDLAAATTATVSGWGALSENDSGDGAMVLRSADVPLVSDDECAVHLGIDPAAETCAGGSGTDSCYGDSGGPLVIVDRQGTPKLAGVVSWGDVCGGSAPGAYTEVPTYTDWIRGRVADPEGLPALSPDQENLESAPTDPTEDIDREAEDEWTVGDDWADDSWTDDDWSEEEWSEEEWVDDEWIEYETAS